MEQEEVLSDNGSRLEILRQKIKSTKTLKTMRLKLTEKGLDILENTSDFLLQARPESYSQEEDNLFIVNIWLCDHKQIRASFIYNLLGNELLDIGTAGQCPKTINQSRLGQKIRDIKMQTQTLLNSLRKTNEKCSQLGKRIKYDWSNENEFDAKSSCDNDGTYKKLKLDHTKSKVSAKMISKLLKLTPSDFMYCNALTIILEKDDIIQKHERTKQEVEVALDELSLISENPSFSENDFNPILNDSRLKDKLLHISSRFQSTNQQLIEKTKLLDQTLSENKKLQASLEEFQNREQCLILSEKDERSKLKQNNELDQKIQTYENQMQSRCLILKEGSEWIQQQPESLHIKEKSELLQSKDFTDPQNCWDWIKTISLTLFEKAQTLQESDKKWDIKYNELKEKLNQENQKITKLAELLAASECLIDPLLLQNSSSIVEK